MEKEKNKRGEWVPKDTRTAAQIATMLELLRLLKKIFPKATIHGHNEFSSKACPSFDVQREFSTL